MNEITYNNYEHYKFELKPLMYPHSALEPMIDTETMHIHHDIQLAGYVNGLNADLDGLPKLQPLPLQLIQPTAARLSLPGDVSTDLIKNSGGVYCHNMYFDMMRPAERSIRMIEPDTYSTRLIKTQFGSLNNFFYDIKKSALGIYGSGWVWVLAEPMKIGITLRITTTANHTIPDLNKYLPLTCLDMWEHAYFLQYKTNKSAYIDSWCRLINWGFMDDKLKTLQKERYDKRMGK